MNNLIELRKAAGFRSAKSFAEKIGVSTSTYSRYEQDPLSIPLERAWTIADELDCSIDQVVGRTGSDSPEDERDRIIANLSESNLHLLDGYLSFLLKETLNEKLSKKQRYAEIATLFEGQFLAGIRDQGDLALTRALESRDGYIALLAAFADESLEARMMHEAHEAYERSRLLHSSATIDPELLESFPKPLDSKGRTPQEAFIDEIVNLDYEEALERLDGERSRILESLATAFEELHPETGRAIPIMDPSSATDRKHLRNLFCKYGKLRLEEL